MELSSAEQLLPSEKDVFSLVGQIENIARLSGVLLSRLEVAPGSVGGTGAEANGKSAQANQATQKGDSEKDVGVPKIQLKISLTSDYMSYLQFLHRLLLIPRIVAIRDLSLSSASASGQSTQLRTILTLDAYWQSLPERLGSIESPIENLSENEKKLLAQVQQSESGGGAAPVVPIVPTGKDDLFAPF